LTEFEIIKYHLAEIDKYYSLLSDLETVGIIVREINSDEDCFCSVAATTKEKEKTGEPWLFSSPNWLDFSEKAEIFMMGYKHCKDVFRD